MSNPASLYTQGFGTRFENLELPLITNRIPTSSDINFPVGKRWIDSVSNTAYTLTSLSGAGGIVTATWTFLGQASGGIDTMTTQDLVVLEADAGNINIVGGSGIVTTGAGPTAMVSIDVPLDVTYGGTGAVSLTDHGVLLGSGTGAISALAVGATGQALMGVTGADPAFTGSPSFSGTVTAGTGLVATTGGVTATAGGITATAGGVTITAGGLDVVADGATIVGTTLINATGDENTTIGNPSGSGAVTINVPSGELSIVGSGNVIGIGNDAASNGVTVGSTVGTSVTTIQGGPSGAVVITGPVQINQTGDDDTLIGNPAGTGTIVVSVPSGGLNVYGDGNYMSIGADDAANTLVFGSSNIGATTNVQAGGEIDIISPIISVTGALTTSGECNINTTLNANTTIGSTAGAGAITINAPGSGFQLNAGTHTIGLGNDSADHVTILGSTTGSSFTFIQGGASGISLATTGSVGISSTIDMAEGFTLNFANLSSGAAVAGTSDFMTGGVVVVPTTAITSTSLVFLSVCVLGTVTVPQAVYVPLSSITDNVSFEIHSADPTDTSSVNYVIFN